MGTYAIARRLFSGGIRRQNVVRQLVPYSGFRHGAWRVINVCNTRSEVIKVPGTIRYEGEDIFAKFWGFVPPMWLITAGWLPAIHKVLLPVGFPDSVASNYAEYVKYNIVQVACISVTRILATQSMLLAVGLSQGGALPLAAVMNWILKDGIGNLGSILVGSSVNIKFDSNPKRYKFYSASLGQVSNLLGILSLWQPHLFLLFTSVGGVFSRIATLALVSSRARIYGDLALNGNLGDVVRTSQAQSTLATLIGTAIGLGLAPIVGASFSSIMAAFIPLSLLTHWTAYKAVSLIQLRTFNRHRYELVLDEYMKHGIVRDRKYIAEKERFLLGEPDSLFPNVQINPMITLDNVTIDVVNALRAEGIHRSVSGVIFTSDSVDSETILREFFLACDPGKGHSDWTRFRGQLLEIGWVLNPSFIYCPTSRVIVDEFLMASVPSTSSAYPSDESRPPLSADIHRLLSRRQVENFNISQLRFRTSANVSDLDEIRHLHAEWFPVYYKDDFYASLTDFPNSDVLVVLASIEGCDNGIVGMITIAVRRKERRFNPSGDLGRLLKFSEEEEITAYILTLGVVDELRQKGVAQLLLERGIREIGKNDPQCRVVYLHVIEYNKPAFRLYRKAGFIEYTTYPEFYFIESIPYHGTLFYRLLESNRESSASSALSLIGKWIYAKLREFVYILKPSRKRARLEYADDHPGYGENSV